MAYFKVLSPIALCLSNMMGYSQGIEPYGKKPEVYGPEPTIHVENPDGSAYYYRFGAYTKPLDSALRINGQRCDTILRWRSPKIHDPIEIQNGVFYEHVCIQNGEFESYTHFSNCTFKRHVHFRWNEYTGFTNFSHSKFESDSYFDSAYYKHLAYFKNAVFYSYADFKFSKFDSSVDFSGAKFRTDAFMMTWDVGHETIFSNSQFGKLALFWDAEFRGPADFSQARFGTCLDFSGSTFHGDFSLHEATLPKFLFLDRVRLTETLDLTTARLNPNVKYCSISVTDADIDKIKLDFVRFRLAWKAGTPWRKIHNSYQKLIAQSKKYGDVESTNELVMRYKGFTYKHKQKNAGAIYRQFWRFVHWLDKKWWNYGLSKELILVRTAQLLLVFFFINMLFFKYFNENLYKLDNIYSRYKSTKGKYKSLHRLIPVLAYTSIIFFRIKFEHSHLNYSNWLAVAYFYVMYVSGIVCLLFFGNYIINQ